MVFVFLKTTYNQYMSFDPLNQASIKKGTRVIVRADFDVAINGDKIINDFRIREVIPTLDFILKKGGIVRIVSHLGRPGGKYHSNLSVVLIVNLLSKILKRKVVLVKNPFDPGSFNKYNGSQDIILFENIRFWIGEEKNDLDFARQLAAWGDCYVNEAFAASHRNHASVVRLPGLLPSFAGLLLCREIRNLGAILKSPRHPFVVVLGGDKLETKLPLVRRFFRVADKIFIGGALSNSIWQAKHLEVGKSFNRDSVISTKDLAVFNNKKIFLPSDVVVATGFSGLGSYARRVGEVRRNEYIVDIGPGSLKNFISLLAGSNTILWNGPLGYIEVPEFAKGTISFAKAVSKIKAFKVVGGGDSIAVLQKHKLLGGFSHVSTGGGAMLEFLVGKKLPGIEILKHED